MNVKLLYPIVGLGGKSIDEIIFRRPTIKDIKRLDGVKGDVERMAILIEAIGTTSEGRQIIDLEVDKLDVEDLGTISEVLESFLAKSPQTGEK